MAALTLEAGKRYVTHLGKVSSVLDRDDPADGYEYPFAGEVDGRCFTWTSEGKVIAGRFHPFDLVAEYVEAPALIAEAA